MSEFAWMIEAPGQQYLGVRSLKIGNNFTWSPDHNKAVRFMSEEQAVLTMNALRDLDRKLFGFEGTLGPARATEHGWMDNPDDSAKRYGERVGQMLDDAAKRITA